MKKSRQRVVVLAFGFLLFGSCPHCSGETVSDEPVSADTLASVQAKVAGENHQEVVSPPPMGIESSEDRPHPPLAQGIPRVDLRAQRDPLDPADRNKKPFDIDGYYQAKGIHSLAVSPDGQTILYGVSSYDLARGRSETDIFAVDFDGTQHRQMTVEKGYDSQPVWAPDGKSFYFVSSREGTRQLWRMAARGGKPDPVTGVATGLSGPVVSPDGTMVAFVSDVFPDIGADDDKTIERMADLETSPFKAHIADNLLFRHWDGWRNFKRSHIMVLNLGSGVVVDVTPGDYDSPIFSPGGSTFAFSPDSKEICFSSNRESPDAQAWTTNSDLFTVPVRGGAPTCITCDNKAWDGDPVYSPDGRYIAYRKQMVPGYESDRTRIALYDREAKTSRILTEGFDASPGRVLWLEDSETLVFDAEEKGRNPLYSLQVESGDLRVISHIPSVYDFTIGPDGRVVFTFTRIGQPMDLYASYLFGKEVGRLTDVNVALMEEYDIRPAEEMWFDAPGGRKIHTWIVKPHGFDPAKTYPLILNIHGGPQSQWVDSLRGDWQVYSAAGYVTAFPNPTGSTGFGHSFTADISRDWGGKVYEDIMAVTDGLAALPYVDEERMGAMGWSYGGYMVNWMLGQTDRFKAVASMMGIFDTNTFHLTTEELWFPEWDLGGTPWDNQAGYAKWNPANHVEKMNTPALIITGEKDFRIPYTQSIMLYTALKRRGVPARLLVFPDDGHWPNHVNAMPLYYAAHLNWFHQYLGGEPYRYTAEDMVLGRAFR